MVERATNPHQTTLNTPRRFAVRLALATGATVATLIGAQRLALLDRLPEIAKPAVDVTASSRAVFSTAQTAPTPTNTALPTSLAPAAPHLIVIRNQGALPSPTQVARASRPPSQAAKQAVPSGGNVIMPPEAVIDQPPVVIQAAPSGGGGGQPAPATHSSR